MNKKFMPYLTVYAILLIILCCIILSYPKAELHMILNVYHGATCEVFFKYYSQLAEWPLYIIALIPIFFHAWRWTAFYTLCEIVSSIIVTAIKWNIDIPRPVKYFAEYPNLHLPLVPGVTLHSTSSFPSGHASTFFIFFTVAALLLSTFYKDKRKCLQPVFQSTTVQQTTLMILLLLAAIGGYSRVFLSQHFISDVAMGSFIGVAVTCTLFFILRKKLLKI